MELMPLSIRDAFSLYRMLAPHLPDKVDENKTVLEYVGQIVKDIKEKKSDSFANALVLMTGLTTEELINMEGEDIINLFINGLVVNQITSLGNFCRGIGLSNG